MRKPIKKKFIGEMTRAEFEALPRRRWDDEDIGKFDSLIILPAKSCDDNLTNEEFAEMAAKRMKGEQPDHIHDSGYRVMSFVAAKGDYPICLLGGCSDVINLNGIGGYGKNWLKKYGSVPETIPPVEWNIDCLPKSGLLRLFSTSRGITVGLDLSNFSVYSEEEK